MNCEKISVDEMQKKREECYSSLNNFEKRLFDNLELLVKRVNELKLTKPGTLGYWTYYDVILIQIRGMFIESPNRKKNYTIQNYLISLGQKEIADEIDNYLKKELYDSMTLKEAIKVSVDKFIVHYDKVDEKEIVIEHMCRVRLTEPDKEYNVANILCEFIDLLMEGIEKAWGHPCSSILKHDSSNLYTKYLNYNNDFKIIRKI